MATRAEVMAAQTQVTGTAVPNKLSADALARNAAGLVTSTHNTWVQKESVYHAAVTAEGNGTGTHQATLDAQGEMEAALTAYLDACDAQGSAPANKAAADAAYTQKFSDYVNIVGQYVPNT